MSSRDEIAEKYYDTAIRIARRIAESEGMDEGDLTGPAFEGLLRSADALIDHPRDGSNPESFIKTAIRNSVLDFVRKERKRTFTGVSADDVIPPLISLQEPIHQDSEQIIEDTLVAQDTDLTRLKSDILEIISRIPRIYRTIFLLKFEDPDVTDQEIATITGLSLSDVQQRIYRGRKYFVSK